VTLVVGINPISSSMVIWTSCATITPWTILLLGLGDARNSLPPYSSLSTLFSWLCGFWGEALDEVTNTFLPNVHLTSSSGKNSCCFYMDCLIYSSSPCALSSLLDWGSILSILPLKPFQDYGMWLDSPRQYASRWPFFPHNEYAFECQQLTIAMAFLPIQ
jgi:hypothetical protein